MRFIWARLFLAAYAGGTHLLYDPLLPWDQHRNRNPRTLASVGPALSRPEGRSVVGPDGALWTGWMAKYGAYGGGISRVDPDTLEVSSWYDPVPGQAIAWLDSDQRNLFFATCGAANGLPTRVEPLHFGVWDTAGKLIHIEETEKGLVPGRIACTAGRVLVSLGARILIFDIQKMGFTQSLATDSPCTCMVDFDGETAVAFCGSKLLRVNPLTCQASLLAEVPENVQTATVIPGGRLFFARGTHLYTPV